MLTTPTAKPANTNTSLATRPVWPLPKLNGARPVLLVADPNDPGVEIAYEFRDEPEGPMVRPTFGSCFPPFYLPALTPVFAIFDGRILYAGKHADGFTVIVEHPNGWMSYYSHLEQMFALATDRRHRGRPQYVKPGHILGYAGRLGDAPLRPLRFELWKLDDDGGYISIDPIRFMRGWRQMPWMQSVPISPGVNKAA